MDFDDAKENIQPLAAGRNASILHASLNVESPHELQAQRHELEQIIHTYQGEDPLEAWYDYISWIEQSYPSGGKESGLEEVLTKCLTAFERDERYFQDRRLIRMYIKFIEMQKNQNATEFYQQLFNEGIGTMVADFYICWAYCYDLSGNYRKADEIFRRGVACRAEPLEELQEAHQHFGFTISQRMLYKDDENVTESANKQIHERRLALSSLRSHRKKVGSVRTGAAVKSYVPGKMQTDTTSTTTRQVNARVHVFSDENENPQIGSAAVALQPSSLVVSEEPSNSKSVVRSIIDLARNQENKKEPGPWNKAHDKKKGKLFRQDSATTELGFEILEDDSIRPKKPKLALTADIITDIKPFKPFPNFVNKNRPLPEWSTPVTIENTTQPRAYPEYHKCKLYPRPNLEYQLEELLAYNWLSKRGIKNNFTVERDAVWKSHEIGAVRKYPNFATKSRPQKIDALDAYYEQESKADLIVDLKQIYNTSEQTEMQFEEIMMKNWQAGVRKIRYDVNQTIMMATEMEETVCMPHDVDPVNRRKSFFPSRKSMVRRTSMLPNKVTQPTLPMQAVCESLENENDVSSESQAEIIKPQTAPITKVGIAEQILNQSFEKFSLNESEQPTTSAAARAKANAIEENQLDTELLPSAPLAHAIYQDSFEFKTPALPVLTGVKPKLPFEIYEESMEERYPPPNNENLEFFEGDETCSTQAFNCFIKQQSVSTPNAQKTAPRIFGTVLKERTELEPVAETSPPMSATPNDCAKDSKVIGTCTSSGTLNFSPPCQKQLSTILETSEQGTNTKSTISSNEGDAFDAKSGVTAHAHLETLKEQSCETTSKDNTIEPNADMIAVEQPLLVTTEQPAAATPAAARLHKGGGVNFSIFEDCPESVDVLPKQVGNFSRLEEHEDTTSGYMIQSIKFQEDKTETVSKMLITARQDVKFPEEKTETFSKLLFASAPTGQLEEDKTENLVKMPFEPPSLDDTFKFFTQTPPKLAKSQIMTAAQERSMLSTTEFLGFDVDDISSAPKHVNKYDDAPQLRDTLSFFGKMNASNREKQATSFKAKAYSKKSPPPPLSVNPLINSLKDSFMPDFSLIEETQPQQQQKPEESYTKQKELSFITDSKPHYCKASILKQNAALAPKPSTAPNKSLMRNSFNLPDFSMVMDSQPTHQQSGNRWQRTEPSDENILTDSYMKDFSAIKEPTPQKPAPNTSAIGKLNSSKSTSFKASENAAKSSANISGKTLAYAESSSAKLQQLLKPLQTSSITTTSAPSRKSAKPDDFFELNAETAQFAPNLSMIRNSTLLPQDAKQRFTQFHEKSLHIKEELPVEISNEISYEMLKSPTDTRKPVPAKTKAAATPLPPKPYPFVPNDDDVSEENSIYFKATPKTPKIQRHIWNHSNEEELPANSNFIHRTPDLNHTQQIIEHVHLDDNVNPFNAELINAFLEQIDFTNFIEDLSTCQLIGKVRQLHKDAIIAVNNVKFKVQKLIGEGTYGAVYCASQMKTGKKYALKQERPPNYWEYYICLEVHSRLAIDELMPAFMNVDYALIGNNASILISPLSAYGSLITVCNKIKRVTTKNCDEYVVMHITCLLLEIMDHLHAIEIIHADIKADNFLLMDKLSYDHKQPSIQLIDFGVSIDMRLFKKNQTFSYVHKENSNKCVEMRENRPWTYQLDLFGLAGVIHVLLFGKYMSVERNLNGFWMHTTHVPRYLNKTLWETIFKSLLNIRDCSSMPKLQNLRVLIKEELAEKESYVMQKIFEFNRVLDC